MGTNTKIRKNASKHQAGDRYDKLMLTGKSYIGEKSRRFVECICDCGKIRFIKFCDILNRHTTSCGCKRKPHGMAANHPIYTAWMNMKNRCYRNYEKSYYDKSLTVCDEWINSFKVFFDWSIKNGWQEGLTIDRIKNEMGYSPNNCRWVTNYEQQRNRTDNVNLTVWGETKCLTDWITDERCVVAFNTVRQRMHILKWDAEKALTYPNMNKEGGNYKRSNSIVIEYNNEKKNLKDWCRILGLKYTTVRNRLCKGWELNKSFKI